MITASAIDAAAFGEYRRAPEARPRIVGRLSHDGSTGVPAEAGRFHVYSAQNSPDAHRLELIRLLTGLADAVTLSHVDGLRDGRGWAFRGPTGPDPVNGFTLLREAYQATLPGHAGPVRVPLLWDRVGHRIVSDEAVSIGVDLATQFGTGASLYPVQQAGEIECISSSIATALTDRLAHAVVDADVASSVRGTLRRLDRRLATRRYLLGDGLTDADLRLWVVLVRVDAGANAHRAIGPDLTHYPEVWRYADELYSRPEFRATTNFRAFTAPFANLPPWTASD